MGLFNYPLFFFPLECLQVVTKGNKKADKSPEQCIQILLLFTHVSMRFLSINLISKSQ